MTSAFYIYTNGEIELVSGYVNGEYGIYEIQETGQWRIAHLLTGHRIRRVYSSVGSARSSLPKLLETGIEREIEMSFPTHDEFRKLVIAEDKEYFERLNNQ